MMTGTIMRVRNDHVERRDEALLPSAWVDSGLKLAPDVAGAGWLHREDPTRSAPLRKGSPTLVMLGSETSPAFPTLLAQAAAGERVYVLVSPEWGRGPVDPRLLAAPRVLIRRVPEVPASGCLTSGEGRIWFGSRAGGPAPWCLRLDPAQSEAWRLLFLRLFWHQATEEGWTGGPQIAFRSAAERPFDVPDSPQGGLVGIATELGVEPADALLHLGGGSVPDVAPRRLWYPPGGDLHDRLARLTRSGTAVVWEDWDLPDIGVGPRGGALWLPGTRGRLRIALNAAQSSEAGRILEQPTSWDFRLGTRLGDHARNGVRLWLGGESAARSIEAEQPIGLPDVQADRLRAVPDATPAAWTAPQALALSVRYRWTVLPPRVPAAADEDALIGRWRRIDEDFSARLRRVREALHATEDQRGRISRAFSRLVGAMLGFERTQGSLLAEITELEGRHPSEAGPNAAHPLLANLAMIEDQARKMQGDMEEAERRAREDEERERQEKAWQSRVTIACHDLLARRETLAQAEARRPDLSTDLSSIDEALKSAEKQAKKDLVARRRRTSDDLARSDRDITRLRGEVTDLEQQTVETFTFVPPSASAQRSASTGRFVPSMGRSATVVPEEALPQVGLLRNHRGQRYLVIADWADLDRGEADAARLNARLVAPENA